MRQVTLTTKVFKFSELSDDAKEKAKRQYSEDLEYLCGSECIECISKAAEYLGYKMSRYQISWDNCSRSYASFTFMNDSCYEDEHEKIFDPKHEDYADTIAQWKDLLGVDSDSSEINVNCKDPFTPFTGTFFDHTASATIWEGIQNGDKPAEIANAVFDDVVKLAQNDYASQFEDQNFSENCDANDYEFFEDGTFFYVGHRYEEVK